MFCLFALETTHHCVLNNTLGNEIGAHEHWSYNLHGQVWRGREREELINLLRVVGGTSFRVSHIHEHGLCIDVLCLILSEFTWMLIFL